MKTVRYPLISCVKDGFKNIVCFDSESNPKNNCFIQELNSGTKIATLAPPPTVKNTQIWGPASQKRSKRTSEEVSITTISRTFALQKLSHLSLPHSLLETKDESASIKSFSLTKEFGGSAHIENTDGDEVWFVYKGAGWCETQLGRLFYKSGDYLYIPKSFRYKINPQADTLMIGMESSKTLMRPCFDDYKTSYNTSAFFIPSPKKIFFENKRKIDTHEVYVKKSHIWTRVEYDTYPNVECIGYKGTSYPFIIDSDNIINGKNKSSFVFLSEDLSAAISTFTTLSTLENTTSVGITVRGDIVYSSKEYFYNLHHGNTSEFLAAFEIRSLFSPTHKACEIEM